MSNESTNTIVEVEVIEEVQVVKPKRTRRTKAQMAEARAKEESTKIKGIKVEEVQTELVEVEMVEVQENEVRTVDALKNQFTTLQDEAYIVSQRLAEDISMLELDETKEMITNAIAELEAFAGANEAVSIGFMSKIGSGLLALPGAKTIAGLVTDVKTEADK